MNDTTLFQEFPDIKEKIFSKPLKTITLPFSNSCVKKLNKILNFHSSLFQNVVFFRHNNFEINILVDEFKESDPAELRKLNANELEKIIVQYIAAIKVCKSMRIDCIDFSKFQLLSDSGIKFPLILRDREEPQLEDILKIFSGIHNFDFLSQRSPDADFLKLSKKFRFNNNRCYLYRFSDFSSNILNSYPITDPGNDSNLKIKIKAGNDIQKNFIKTSIYHNFFSDDVLFINSGPENIYSMIVSLLRKKTTDYHSDYIKVMNELKLFMKRSSYRSIMLIVDDFERKEDIEFIKYLLDSKGIPNIVFIYFGDKRFIDFDIELKENPLNLLRDYLKFDEADSKVELEDDEIRVLKVFQHLHSPVPKRSLSKVFSKNELDAVNKLLKKKPAEGFFWRDSKVL